MKNKKRFKMAFLGILVVAACSSTGNKKESGFQTTCYKEPMSNRTKLTDAEISMYAIQLPQEINADTERNLKDGKLIEAVKLIRGCLDIDLMSSKLITDRMKLRLKAN